MNSKIEEWLFKFGEITELQDCMIDVLENCMFKGEKPYYALTLMNEIRTKSSDLYEEIDNLSLFMDKKA